MPLADGALMKQHCAVTALALASIIGCSTFEGMKSDLSLNDQGASSAAHGVRTAVVVGKLEPPARSPIQPRVVAAGMSDALADAMLAADHFDVWINPRITHSAQQAASDSTASKRKDWEAIRAQHPNLKYIVLGQVTDFIHTGSLPSEYSRKGLFGRKSEAVVAMDLRVVDLDTRRVVATEHVIGRADADADVDPKVFYEGVEFGSYMFWSTPLGAASRQAIDQAVANLDNTLPSTIGDPAIAARLSTRQVRIDAGSIQGVDSGREYYLVTTGPGGYGDDMPILDDVTGQPVRARIASVKRDSATAWLVGRPPENTPLIGARLRKTLPLTSPASIAASTP